VHCVQPPYLARCSQALQSQLARSGFGADQIGAYTIYGVLSAKMAAIRVWASLSPSKGGTCRRMTG
jgi:hypothetical protein